MDFLQVISRVVHVSTAIAVVGGTTFMLFVLMPAAKTLADEAHAQLAEQVKDRWKRFIHLGILLFLITGFYNYFNAMSLHKGDGPYHALLGTKMLIAFVMFFIASALVGRSNTFAKMRENRATWLRVLVLLAFVVVAISGYVKVRGSKTLVTSPSPSTSGD